MNEAAGDEWSECIEPNGRTLYRRGGEVEEGRLEIRPDGQACFNYPPDTYWSCFDVTHEGENYRFDSFITRTVRRDVRGLRRPQQRFRAAWCSFLKIKWKFGTLWRDAGANNEEARRFRDALLLDIRP